MVLGHIYRELSMLVAQHTFDERTVAVEHLHSDHHDSLLGVAVGDQS